MPNAYVTLVSIQPSGTVRQQSPQQIPGTATTQTQQGMFNEKQKKKVQTK